jgi:ArsR family transcriptional regulator
MLISPEALLSGTTQAVWRPSPHLAELASLLRTIGDPRRLSLLHLLAQRETCVCEFEDALGWPQNLVSHHLGVLRRAGLIASRRDAQWVYYSLVPERFGLIRSLLDEALPASLPPEARYGAAPRIC